MELEIKINKQPRRKKRKKEKESKKKQKKMKNVLLNTGTSKAKIYTVARKGCFSSVIIFLKTGPIK